MKLDRPVVKVEDIASGAGGLWFDSRRGQMGDSFARKAHHAAAMFLLSYAAQALSLGDGPRHSFHASA